MQMLLSLSISAYFFFVSVQGDCTSDRDRGNDTCSGAAPSTRWYFNPKKFHCMAFTYLGCGGNDNNFESFSACLAKCHPADSLACFGAAFAPPAPIPAGALKLGPHWCQATGCPNGYECKTGASTSQCCNSATESWFKEAENPKCRNNQTALQSEDHVTVADSCSDLTCPEGYTCQITNQLFAKCCK